MAEHRFNQVVKLSEAAQLKKTATTILKNCCIKAAVILRGLGSIVTYYLISNN